MEPARFSTASSNIVFSLLKAEVRTKLSFLQITHTGTQRKQFLYKRKSQASGTFASNLYFWHMGGPKTPLSTSPCIFSYSIKLAGILTKAVACSGVQLGQS